MEREYGGKGQGPLFSPSNSLRKGEGCNERGGKGLLKATCHQHPLLSQKLEIGLKPSDWGRGRYDSMNTRKWCKRIVLPFGERCFSDTKGSCSVARCGGEYTAVLAAWVGGPAATGQPWLQLLAGKPPARRRPVAGGLCPSPLLPASRRAPPAQHCGERRAPATLEENRSRMGLRWQRGKGR